VNRYVFVPTRNHGGVGVDDAATIIMFLRLCTFYYFEET